MVSTGIHVSAGQASQDFIVKPTSMNADACHAKMVVGVKMV